MKAKHTPGPWKELHGEIRTDDEGLGIRIAEIDYWQKSRHEGNCNARLITASPDLLKVAKAIEAMNLLRLDFGVGQELVQAIAKAEGEPTPSAPES